MKPITVVGSANIDHVMHVPHLPAPGETVTDGDFQKHPGGKGANQAVAVARAGAPTVFIGAMGQGVEVEEFLAGLNREGIDTESVLRMDEAPSGTAMIMVDGQGENVIGVAPASNALLNPDHIQACAARIQDASWIILQQEIPVAANQAVLEIAKEHEIPVLLNWAPADRNGLRPGPEVEVLVMNEVETEALIGIDFDPGERKAAITLAEEIREQGGHHLVVITLGPEGVVYSNELGAEHQPAFDVDVVDTTAAGDTFCGALTVALREGKSDADAIRWASAAGALAVTRAGAQPSIPTREEIEAFLAGR